MDRDSLLDLITTEDVIKLLVELGSDPPSKEGDAYVFNTVCHETNGKRKLYYYPNSKLFQCYNCCGSMSIYDLIMNALNMKFEEAFYYLKEFKGIKNSYTMKVGITTNKTNEEDFEFLKRHLYKRDRKKIKLPTYDSKIMKMFDNYIPINWEEEGISQYEMSRFNIKMDLGKAQIIIPNRDIDGDLVGIRARNFDKYVLDKGMKYSPIKLEKKQYSCPTGYNLYGIYENKEAIERIKKCIIVEGEKSVLLYGSYFGCKNNIALATLGSTLSNYQRDIIIDRDVEETIIAYDKDFLYSEIAKDNKEHIKKYNKLVKNLIKMYNKFGNYCNFSVIFPSDDELLGYKQSPLDNGKDIFIELYRNRIIINDVEELKSAIIE